MSIAFIVTILSVVAVKISLCFDGDVCYSNTDCVVGSTNSSTASSNQTTTPAPAINDGFWVEQVTCCHDDPYNKTFYPTNSTILMSNGRCCITKEPPIWVFFVALGAFFGIPCCCVVLFWLLGMKYPQLWCCCDEGRGGVPQGVNWTAEDFREAAAHKIIQDAARAQQDHARFHASGWKQKEKNVVDTSGLNYPRQPTSHA